MVGPRQLPPAVNTVWPWTGRPGLLGLRYFAFSRDSELVFERANGIGFRQVDIHPGARDSNEPNCPPRFHSYDKACRCSEPRGGWSWNPHTHKSLISLTDMNHVNVRSMGPNDK